MYQMIGGDDQEYGPVTVEQMREWIAVGRADGQTKLKKIGEPDFKPLAAFAEFAEALAAKSAQPTPSSALPAESTAPPAAPAAPPPAPPGMGTDPDSLANEALGRSYSVNVGLTYGRAWELLKSDLWPIVGVSAVVFLLLGAANAAYVGIVVTGPLMGGLFNYYLKRIRSQPAQMSDAFVGFSENFLQLFLGGLVSSLLTGIGLLLCIIPGIYLGVAWQFTFPIILEKKIGFWEAMEASRKVLTRHWWGMFLLLLTSLLINFCGLLACGVGVFVTMPLTMMAIAYAYNDLFGPPEAPAPIG